MRADRDGSWDGQSRSAPDSARQVHRAAAGQHGHSERRARARGSASTGHGPETLGVRVRRRRSRPPEDWADGVPKQATSNGRWRIGGLGRAPDGSLDGVAGSLPDAVARSFAHTIRRPRRLEWWLVGSFILILLLTTWLAFDQVVSDRRSEVAEGVTVQPQPTVVATVEAHPTPSIRYSFARLEGAAGGPIGAEPVGVVPGAPSVDARSAIVVDMGSRVVLYAKNPRQRLPMASTLKIVTATVALEYAPLNTIIEVPPEAAAMEPNRMGLQAGERLTLEELLYGLLLDSGNDAAEAIARGLLGDRVQFMRLMNRQVAKLGLHDSRFVNPAGFDDPAQYTTAYDLAVLTTYALQNPTFRKIVGTRRKVIPASQEPGHEHGWFAPTTLNALLRTYPGAFGVKPGWTGEARYTLVAGAEREGRRLLVVVLGSNVHFTDATRLLDYGFATPRR